MYERIPTPISELDSMSSYIEDDNCALFIISSDNSELSAISFSSLVLNLSNDLSIENTIDLISNLLSYIENNNNVSVISDPSKSMLPYVISSITQNNTGRISKIGSIALSTCISNIITNTQYSQLCSINSPWVLTSNIASETGDSDELVASQKLVHQIYQELTSNYVLSSNIATEIGDSDELIASQKLVTDLSSDLTANYVLKTDIATDSNDNFDSNDILTYNVVNQFNDMLNNFTSNYIKPLVESDVVIIDKIINPSNTTLNVNDKTDISKLPKYIIGLFNQCVWEKKDELTGYVNNYLSAYYQESGKNKTDFLNDYHNKFFSVENRISDRFSKAYCCNKKLYIF